MGARDRRGLRVPIWRAAGLGSDEDFTRRIRRECPLTAKLTGAHVIPIHGYGEIDGRFYTDAQHRGLRGAHADGGGAFGTSRCVEPRAPAAPCS